MNFKNILASVLLAVVLTMTCAPAYCQTAEVVSATQSVAASEAAANAPQVKQAAAPDATQAQPDKNAGESAQRRTYWRMLHLIRITVLVLILLMLINNRRSRRRW
jgi:hypothetical protein